MPDELAAFKAALARVNALADKALDMRLMARKPKPEPVAPPEPDGDEAAPDEELSEDEKAKLLEMYGEEG